MSYIGNQVTSVPHVVDVFSGNGVTTSFGPLVRAPAGVAAIAVFVSGVYQTPGFSYTLNSDSITFTSAPTSGVNNIVIHHLGNGTTTQVPSDGSVTGTKLTPNSIRGNNIVAGQITSNLFAPNLAITVSKTNETTNLFSTAPNGNINIDVANTSLYYFTSNTTANVTFNLRANNNNTFDSVIGVGETVTVSIMLRHSTTTGGRHTANLAIDGGLISTNRANPDAAGANNIFYVGNVVPVYVSTVPGSGLEMNMYNISVFKRAANTYTVFFANTTAQLG